MRILFLHQHFYPETVGTSTRAVEIVEYLVKQGHQVTVVTGIPSHPSTMASGEVSRKQRREQEFRGARVVRVWTYGSRGRDSFLRRMLTYSSFMVLGALKAMFVSGEYDVLVAISPLPNGVAGRLVAWWRKLPLMFDVCDIWPDCAVAVGMLRGQPLIRLALALEKGVYNSSRRIGVVTRGFTDNIVAKGIPRQKISLLPDWVMPELYDPALVDRESVRREYDLQDRFVVSFLGNFGLIMGLEEILETARQVKDVDPSVLFLFVGKGVGLPIIEDRIARWDLDNVRVIPYQPRNKVPGLLAASDALIVTYKKTNITLITVASKVYEYMSIARPIIAGVDGVLGDILTDAGCAFVSRTRDPQEMALAIMRLKKDPELGRTMGAAGRQYAIENFAFARVAADYERTVAETAGAALPEVSTHRPSNESNRLSIIIVNWNTREMLRACLRSIEQEKMPDLEVIVVDNGSTDGSPEMVLQEFPRMRLLFPGINLGFGGANNVGLRAASGRLIMLLNSDTEVEPRALETMCEVLEKDSTIGAIGSRLILPDGSTQLSCRRFPSHRTALFNRYSLLTRFFPKNRFSSAYLMSKEDYDKPLEPDWVVGASLMIPRSVYEKVGGFDESYFMYAEDVDWCYRIRQAGWRIVYDPRARVKHHLGGSTRLSPYRMIFERHRSMWIFYRKHYSRGIVLVDVATWVGIASRCSLLEIQAFFKRLARKEVRA